MDYKIQIKCSYCRKHLGYKIWGYDPKGGHTDSVCPKCYDKVMEEIDKIVVDKEKEV